MHVCCSTLHTSTFDALARVFARMYVFTGNCDSVVVTSRYLFLVASATNNENCSGSSYVNEQMR